MPLPFQFSSWSSLGISTFPVLGYIILHQVDNIPTECKVSRVQKNWKPLMVLYIGYLPWNGLRPLPLFQAFLNRSQASTSGDTRYEKANNKEIK